MQREDDHIFFTEEDKKNIAIKKHTESEMEEKLKVYKKKRNTRRIIYAVIFAILIAATRVEWDWVKYWAYIAICFMIFLMLVYEYVDRIELKALSRGLYYIEVCVEKKLPKEHSLITTLSAGSGFIYFYPVEGTDINSGYRSVFYIEEEQYKEADIGKIVRVGLRGKKEYIEKLIAEQNYH